MLRKFMISVFFICLFCPFSEAATITLTTGQTFKAKIIRRDENAVTVQHGSGQYRYFLDQISNLIEEDGDVPLNPLNGSEAQSNFKNKEDMILKLAELNGTVKNMEDSMQNIINQAPWDQQARLRELFDAKELMRVIIPIYDKYYTEAEVLELIRFYEDSLGQKVVEVTPKILKETVEETIRYFAEKMKK